MKDELIALAKEAGCVVSNGGPHFSWEEAERFANLVAAKEREKVAHWMMQRALATGHGDTIEDLLVELEWQVREKEREAMLAELRLLADAKGNVKLWEVE